MTVMFTFMTALSENNRKPILSVILFFVVGGVLLTFVNVEEGQRAIQESEG